MQFHRCAARKPTACIKIQGKINHRTETKKKKEKQQKLKKKKKHQ